MQVTVLRQRFAVRQITVRTTGLIFGTEDQPLLSECVPDFWGHVGIATPVHHPTNFYSTVT
jgi:hypothetical protein